jgi:N-acetylglucosaminyldiphosphoundecaprenol N-acetyl-beta-D-mannosaminyltransferase
MGADTPRTGRVIGAPVSVGDPQTIADTVLTRAHAAAPGYVCVANVHMVTLARQDPDLLRAMEDAWLVTSDGMPLVWCLRNQGWHEARRVTGPDLTVFLCARAEAGRIPVYFYGGRPTTLAPLKDALAKRFPDLPIAGLESPPLLPDKPPFDPDTAARIKASQARIVFVGLGCPKQEFWMAQHFKHIPAVLLGVGAAFDFLAETVKRAPHWMQQSGLEWFFRLISEPKRLWQRYLTTNSRFLYYLLKDLLHGTLSPDYPYSH